MWLAFRGVDTSSAFAVLSGASLGYVALAAICKLAALVIATWRWQFFTGSFGLGLTFRQLWRANLVFNGINQLLPSTIGGEVARYKWLAKGVDRRRLIASQALDKASLYLFTLSAGLFVMLAFLPAWSQSFPLLATTLSSWGLAAGNPTELARLGFVTLAIFAVLSLGAGAILRACRPLGPYGQRFWAFGSFWRHQVISFSFLANLTLCFFFCLKAVGLEISFAICAKVFPLMAALGLVPVAISGFGLREASAVVLLGPLTGQNHVILAGSLLFGLLAVCTSLPGLVMVWNRFGQPVPSGETTTVKTHPSGSLQGESSSQSTLAKIAPAVTAAIPTSKGHVKMELFVDPEDQKEHVAVVFGDVAGKANVLARVHSECFTGDIFGSLRCDCGPQLDGAMAAIAKEGEGVLLYMRQEGRGIGLVEKLKAYNLQDQGYDTVEANVMLGHGPDERDYTFAAKMFQSLGVKSLRLITNNPDKIDSLTEFGLNISERVALPLAVSKENSDYLRIKAEKMKHIFTTKL